MNNFNMGVEVRIIKILNNTGQVVQTYEGRILNLEGLQVGVPLVLVKNDGQNMSTSVVKKVTEIPSFNGSQTCIFDTDNSRYHCIEL